MESTTGSQRIGRGLGGLIDDAIPGIWNANRKDSTTDSTTGSQDIEQPFGREIDDGSQWIGSGEGLEGVIEDGDRARVSHAIRKDSMLDSKPCAIHCDPTVHSIVESGVESLRLVCQTLAQCSAISSSIPPLKQLLDPLRPRCRFRRWRVNRMATTMNLMADSMTDSTADSTANSRADSMVDSTMDSTMNSKMEFNHGIDNGDPGIAEGFGMRIARIQRRGRRGSGQGLAGESTTGSTASRKGLAWKS